MRKLYVLLFLFITIFSNILCAKNVNNYNYSINNEVVAKNNNNNIDKYKYKLSIVAENSGISKFLFNFENIIVDDEYKLIYKPEKLKNISNLKNVIYNYKVLSPLDVPEVVMVPHASVCHGSSVDLESYLDLSFYETPYVLLNVSYPVGVHNPSTSNISVDINSDYLVGFFYNNTSYPIVLPSDTYLNDNSTPCNEGIKWYQTSYIVSSCFGSFNAPNVSYGQYCYPIAEKSGLQLIIRFWVYANYIDGSYKIVKVERVGSGNLRCQILVAGVTVVPEATVNFFSDESSSLPISKNIIAEQNTYYVELTVEGVTSIRTPINISYLPDPTAGITNNTGITFLSCPTNQSISLTATGGGTYNWNNSLGTNANVNVTASGTYTVTVTGSNGCTASQSV
ncbi:MAG: hypothetical protein LBV69_07035, partial [Bacteroidales bacterium]|nr:hypothetical protein [Bacteroidales bacterium]